MGYSWLIVSGVFSSGVQKHTLLLEHSDAVSALAVIKDKLVSGSWDTNIKVRQCYPWVIFVCCFPHAFSQYCLDPCLFRSDRRGYVTLCLMQWQHLL